MNHYLIIVNGVFLNTCLLNEVARNKTIIALDGATDKLKTLGIQPHIILGDFDSITPQTAGYWGVKQLFADIDDDSPEYEGHFGVKIVPAKNQDATDLMKAIEYCDANKADQIEIVCALGGRLDHQEANIRMLRRYHQPNRSLLLYSETQVLKAAKDEDVVFTGEIGDKCGIAGFPHAVCTSTGLAYELQDYVLNYGYSDSMCNTLTQTQVTLKISGEALLILPGQLAAQR